MSFCIINTNDKCSRISHGVSDMSEAPPHVMCTKDNKGSSYPCMRGDKGIFDSHISRYIYIYTGLYVNQIFPYLLIYIYIYIYIYIACMSLHISYRSG